MKDINLDQLQQVGQRMKLIKDNLLKREAEFIKMKPVEDVEIDLFGQKARLQKFSDNSYCIAIKELTPEIKSALNLK